MARFFLESVEDGVRMTCGLRGGYHTLAEATADAKALLDATLPGAAVRILAHVATARVAGDGSETVRGEAGNGEGA